MLPEDLQQQQPETAPPVEPPVVPQRVPFWGYVDLLLVIGLFVAAVVFVLAIVALIQHFHPELKIDQPAVAFPFQFAVYGAFYLALWLVFWFRHDNPSVFHSLGWRQTPVNLYLVGLGGIALAFAIDLLATLVHPPQIKTPFDHLADGPLGMFLLAITAIFVGPLFEELSFRGFLQPLLSRTLGSIAGILITALLFGTLHAAEYEYAWQYVAAISIVGIVLGIVRQRTNSIIPTTVLHGCFNSVSVAGLIASKFLHIPHK